MSTLENGMGNLVTDETSNVQKSPVVHFSWADVHEVVLSLAQELSHSSFDVVVGISRSGLVPAVVLSHVLGIRDFCVLDIVRTESDEIEAPKQPPEIRSVMNEDLVRARRVLLVDDIVGKGLTLDCAGDWLRGRCAALTTAALVVNKKNLGERAPESAVDHYGYTIFGWAVFPWEGKA